MSFTTLYAVRENKNLHPVKDFGNSFAGALLVWLTLAEKYGIPNGSHLLLNEKVRREVWDLASREDVSEADQLTMQTTFDCVLVHKENFKQLVKAMKESAKTLPKHCTILQQAETIETLIDDPDIIAIGWNQTSVVDTWEDYLHENEYNLKNADKHWYMFDKDE